MAEANYEDLSSILDRLGVIERWIYRNKQIKGERRREGYYWVRIEGRNNWNIGHWDIELKFWTILGTEISYDDKNFDKIGPCMSPPEEGEQDGRE